MTGGKGGISLDQYRTIRSMPDIDVAVPVAVLVFFTNNTGGIHITLPEVADQVKLMTVRVANRTGLPEANNMKHDTHIMVFPYQDFPIVPSRVVDLEDTGEQRSVEFPLPEQYHLLMAVDPEQEDSLTNHQLHIRSQLKDVLPKDSKGIPELPLLVNEDVDIPMKAVVELRTSPEPPEKLRYKAEYPDQPIEDISQLEGTLFRDILLQPANRPLNTICRPT